MNDLSTRLLTKKIYELARSGFRRDYVCTCPTCEIVIEQLILDGYLEREVTNGIYSLTNKGKGFYYSDDNSAI